MADPYDHPDVHALIQAALREDLRFTGDRTALACVPADTVMTAQIIAKAPGTVCGLALFPRVLAALAAGDPALTATCTGLAADGTPVRPGMVLGTVAGSARVVLAGERTALNLCQHLSGIATATAALVALVAHAAGTRAQVLDTRKTIPGLRVLAKHAVAAGGGANHRHGLHDAILIKNNHIALMGADGPATAVRRARASAGTAVRIQVEIDRVADLVGVIAAGADLVLLDNMGLADLRAAVAARDAADPRRRVLLEASGGITAATIRAVAETGVDRISTGAITHSAPALDLALHAVAPPRA
jgi:nicotinate-nucleotide pyrophosphorylase (carboxylating)